MTVEEMVERLLRVVAQAPPKPDELGPMTRALSGVAPAMTDAQVEQVLDEERLRKHGGG